MFEIHEVIHWKGVNKRSNKNRTIFKPYEHKINLKQFND